MSEKKQTTLSKFFSPKNAGKSKTDEDSPGRVNKKVLEVHEESQVETRYWDMLPNEILEKILLALPSYQLPLNESWVCKKWTRMILRPGFWVRKLENSGIHINEKIWSILQESEDNEITSCLRYASLYQEYCIQKYPVPDFFLSVPDFYIEYKWCHKCDEFDKWCISNDMEDTLSMAAGVLVCRILFPLVIRLNQENIKGLSLLLKLLVAKEVQFDVQDVYAFWNFSVRPGINFIPFLKESGYNNNDTNGRKRHRFVGCLSTLEGLPEDFLFLKLAIGVDEKNVAIDPGLSTLSNKFSTVMLHFKATTDFSELSDMYCEHGFSCWISGLEPSHLPWMSELSKKFFSNTVVYNLDFFKSTLDLNSSENLLKTLAESGLGQLSQINIVSPYIHISSCKNLNNLTQKLWPGFGQTWIEIYNCDENLIKYLNHLPYNFPFGRRCEKFECDDHW